MKARYKKQKHKGRADSSLTKFDKRQLSRDVRHQNRELEFKALCEQIGDIMSKLISISTDIIIQYQAYIQEHRQNVMKAYEFLKNEFEDQFPFSYDDWTEALIHVQTHDQSKYLEEEFTPYALYFYGPERTREVKDNFAKAWNHHQKHNPHHWQYWLLIPDDGETECLPIPNPYVIEMLCDWLSFAIKSDNLSKALGWYNDNKSKIKLHDSTRKIVDEFYEDLENWIGDIK